MVDNIMSQMATAYMMMMVSRPMLTIEGCRVAMLPLVVFNCGSSTAILARRQHMLGYVAASIAMRIISECFQRLFRGKGWRGVVNGNLLLRLHLCEERAWRIEWVGGWKLEEKRWAELLFEDMNAIITEVKRRLTDCIIMYADQIRSDTVAESTLGHRS